MREVQRHDGSVALFAFPDAGDPQVQLSRYLLHSMRR